VTFVDVEVWDRQAETASEFLSKGSPALIEGRLKLDSWESKQTGERRSKLRVVGERVQFLGGRREGKPDSGGRRPQGQGRSRGQDQAASQGQDEEAPQRQDHEGDFPVDDDIPF